MAFPYGQTFKDALSKLKREGRYRVFADIIRHRGAFPTASHHTQNAVKPITVWCSNDYLCMGKHPKVVAAMREAIETAGAGSGGTRNISGTNHFHVELERELADLHGKESALGKDPTLNIPVKGPPAGGGAGGWGRSTIVGQTPLLVRADITFLRQDFSAQLPVEVPGQPEPLRRRFDFVVRTRQVGRTEQKKWEAVQDKSDSQREAVLLALREHTPVNRVPHTGSTQAALENPRQPDRIWRDAVVAEDHQNTIGDLAFDESASTGQRTPVESLVERSILGITEEHPEIRRLADVLRSAAHELARMTLATDCGKVSTAPTHPILSGP